MRANVVLTIDGVEYRGKNAVSAVGLTTIRNYLISADVFGRLKFWIGNTALDSAEPVGPPTSTEIAGGTQNRQSIQWLHSSTTRSAPLTPSTLAATHFSETEANAGNTLFSIPWDTLQNAAGNSLPDTISATSRITLTWELNPGVSALSSWPSSLSGIGGVDDYSQTLRNGDSQYLQALRNISRRLLTAATPAGELRVYNDTEDDAHLGDPAFLRLLKVHSLDVTLSADGAAGLSTPSFTIPASGTWSPGAPSGRSLTAGTFVYALMIGTDASAIPIALHGPNVGEGGTFQSAVSGRTWGADLRDA